jgi:23S rRNA pseudouridine2604 synthase
MKQNPNEKKTPGEKVGTRINVYLREEQIASRRGADELVAAGRVFVNGVAAKPGTLVYEGDLVQLKGEEKKYHYFAYNKPRGNQIK